MSAHVLLRVEVEDTIANMTQADINDHIALGLPLNAPLPSVEQVNSRAITSKIVSSTPRHKRIVITGNSSTDECASYRIESQCPCSAEFFCRRVALFYAKNVAHISTADATILSGVGFHRWQTYFWCQGKKNVNHVFPTVLCDVPDAEIARGDAPTTDLASKRILIPTGIKENKR